MMYSAKWKQREIGVTQFTQGIAEAFKKAEEMGSTSVPGEDPIESSTGAGLSYEQKVN